MFELLGVIFNVLLHFLAVACVTREKPNVCVCVYVCDEILKHAPLYARVYAEGCVGRCVCVYGPVTGRT